MPAAAAPFHFFRRHDFVAGCPNRANDFLDQRRVICRVNRHRITGLEG
jgi:hypothetical protein